MLAMTFEAEIKGTKTIQSLQWYVGQPNPANYHTCSFILEVHASGDELTHVVMMLVNFGRLYGSTYKGADTDIIAGLITTYQKKKAVRWFGDEAKFIVANLLT